MGATEHTCNKQMDRNLQSHEYGRKNNIYTVYIINEGHICQQATSTLKHNDIYFNTNFSARNFKF